MPIASWAPSPRAPSSSSSSATSDRALSQARTPSERHRLLLAALERTGADVLLLVGLSAKDPDIAALLGPVHLGEPFVLAAPDSALHLGFPVDMEREEAARTGLALLGPDDLGLTDLPAGTMPAGERLAHIWMRGLLRLGLERGTVAVAGRQSAGIMADAIRTLGESDWQVVAAEEAVLPVRKRKLPWEVAEIRRAADGLCAAMRAVAELLASAANANGNLVFDGDTLTAGHLRRVIDLELGRRGLSQPEGNIVSAGRDAAIPHTQGADDRVLMAGESIVVDLYPKGHLFADCTRSFCVGTIPAPLAGAHALVQEVLEQAATEARPGDLAADHQARAYSRFEESGYATARSQPGTKTGFVHSLGHGVGFEIHEPPRYHLSGDVGRFAVGDVFTLEPGLYDPSAGYGIRLEDLYLMEEEGAELLTPLPYTLDPRAW